MKQVALQLDLFTGRARPGEIAVLGMADRRAADDPRPAPAPAAGELHEHSLAARERRADEHRGRKALILDCLRIAEKPLTDRQIRDALGFQDMNAVRPRITEMIKERSLIEVSEMIDETTGETVRTVWLAI